MINAYAASEPKGKPEPFAYDPGELKPHEVALPAQTSRQADRCREKPGHHTIVA